ncbi:ribosomal protein L11 methyltransferase [Thioflavicoccus mobilis 8321]|uniref:Ribosomal protein L11 methyltransferase n=1 Tax=Thioflavicoccus mobilis 8321 TaxID=765912 RepID=L0GTC3_9GAMM|nr:50S ribosomal protein L11 methyltransferase [Thioflavicoccus mobilis]AGA89057.1 ribosomal protein L11 methyltransferase [Thioflavicoccus mobilis 8321]
MSWLQITVAVRRAEAEAVEAAMEAAGAAAVTFADAADEPQLEPPPGATPLWQAVQVTGLFSDDATGQAQVRELDAALRRLVDTAPVVARLADQVWERVWLDTFRPTRFGRRLWVCPHGQRPDDPQAVVVALDPGLAFGTGHHPTTALCLAWLDASPLAGETLIDYGCGSGILAIAAARLGAARIVAIDHDPQALEATRANAAANGVAERILVCDPDQVPAMTADRLVANILAAPLFELAGRFAGYLRPGGALALSGILAEQVEAVAAAYAEGFALNPPQHREDWVLLGGRRLADSGSRA